MTVWRKRDDVAVVDSGDRVVVLNLSERASGVPRALEGTGGDIWRLIDGVRSDEELIRELSDSYRVSAATISADVRAFLSQLEQEGLVSSTETTTGDAR